MEDARFTSLVEELRPQLAKLCNMEPVTPEKLPRNMPRKGIYLLSEGDKHLYVGRSNDLQSRVRNQLGATHNSATFAFRLAREATGKLRATYTPGVGSRAGLLNNSEFVAAFESAKERIRKMHLRFVEEEEPVRQALLQIYAALTLNTQYNDFDNH